MEGDIHFPGIPAASNQEESQYRYSNQNRYGQGGRGYKAVHYTSPQSFKITFFLNLLNLIG